MFGVDDKDTLNHIMSFMYNAYMKQSHDFANFIMPQFCLTGKLIVFDTAHIINENSIDYLVVDDVVDEVMIFEFQKSFPYDCSTSFYLLYCGLIFL